MQKTRDKILLVDDDQALCQLLVEFLNSDGFETQSMHAGQQALEIILDKPAFDAVVLDIMMPDVSGLEVLQIMRAKTNLPVLMLTGRGDDIDRIMGLEMGADDYIGKPCNPRELAARLKAVLRRAKYGAAKSIDYQRTSMHGISLDTGAMQVTVNHNIMALTAAEFKILQLFMQYAGQVLSKSFLTEQVLNRKLKAHDRSIDVHVSRIRQKLLEQGKPNSIIKAIRGVGYQMICDDKNHV